MPVRLIFLRNEGYFFDSTTQLCWTEELDPFLKVIFSGITPGVPKIRQLICLETVTQTNGRTASFVVYRDTFGGVQTRTNVVDTHPKLQEWLEEKEHQAERYQVSLGPAGQFFASSDCGYRWSGVGEDFQEEMQENMLPGGGWKPEYTPTAALFGLNRSFIILYDGGKHASMSANLEANYPDLFQELCNRLREKAAYQYININPYGKNEWLVVWKDGKIAYNLPPTFVKLFPSPSAQTLWSDEGRAPGSSSSSMSDLNSGNASAARKPSTSSHTSTSSLPLRIPPRTGPPIHARMPQSTRPSLIPGRVEPSKPDQAVYEQSLQFGRPQHSTIQTMMPLLKAVGKMAANSSGNGSSGGSQAFNGVNFFNPNPYGSPILMGPSTFTGGMGVDPVGMQGGAGFDPSILSGMGLDPMSAMNQGTNDCCVM